MNKPLKSGLVFDANFEHPTFQGVITFRHVNPGCRFACPGLCAPLGLQPALANSETSASHYISQKRMALFECFLNSKKNQVKLFSTSSLIINELHNAFGLA